MPSGSVRSGLDFQRSTEMSSKEFAQLCEASKQGKLETVRQLLGQGISPNAKGEINTPLMLAARFGHEEVFFELLDSGADLHGQGEYGGTVLIELAGGGTPRMLKALLDDGLRKSDDLPMAFVNACEVGTLKAVMALIEAGADVNPKKGGAPILYAAQRNRPAIVAELLKRGASTTPVLPTSVFGDKKYFKKTAMEIALMKGYTEVAELLKAAGATLPEKPLRPATPGTVADSWKMLEKWLKKNAPGWKALHRKATAKEIEAAERELGRPLPEGLRESYQLHNGGGRIFPSDEGVSFEFLPLAQVVAEWKIQKGLLEGGDFDRQPAKSAAGVQKTWWNLGWIPFASNGAGDLFCIDLAPAEGGTPCQVISHDHENGEHKLIARSFRHLLHELVFDLQEGKSTFNEDEEAIV